MIKKEELITRWAVVTTRFRAVHNWPTCNIKAVKFLKNEHHHEFNVKVHIQQFHDARDIEYLVFQKYIDKIVIKMLKALKKKRSCEDMAKYINNKIKMDYPNRLVKVELNEDGYYGACVEPKIINEYDRDVAWLAGFVDGEGTITAYKTKRKNGYAYVSLFSIANTNKKAIDKCVDILRKYVDDRGIKVYKYISKEYKWKPRYSISLTRQEVIHKICKILQPYLIIKRVQAELTIRLLVSRARQNKGIKNNANNFYANEQIKLAKKIQSLNKVGTKTK